jgi:uncharacterized protein YdeI (YjbR/CyaY-like superfamily)
MTRRGQERRAPRTDAVAKSFRSQAAFRAWLEKNGASASELMVRCYKVEHQARGLTYRGALDEALCFGWIDGVRHALDEVSFSTRFTPRKNGSAWSRVNVERAEGLRAEGRMQPPGETAFARRKSTNYSFETAPVPLAPVFARRLRADRGAWRFFEKQPPGYRRIASFWVMRAKREETREKRFEVLLASSAAGERIPPLRRVPRRQESGRG